MMKGLVDYGSDSGEEHEKEESVSLPTSLSNGKSQELSANELPDGFFDDDSVEKAEKGGILDDLPLMNETGGRSVLAEGDLEDFLTVRKGWEKKLAKKSQKEQEKSKKKRIGAFSALRINLKEEEKLPDNVEMRKEMKEAVLTFDEKPKCSLLSDLPKPKTASTKGAALMVPNVLTKPSPSTATKRLAPRPLVQASDSESDDETTDFFGLSSTSKVPMRAQVPEPNLPDVPIFLDEVAPGPSKPLPKLYSEPGPASSNVLGSLSDDAARKIIYERELAPWGYSEHEALDAVNQIVDVSVDKALGPNIRENLLKNLNSKNMAQISIGPLPKIQKDPADKLSKRKHQITYLATQAVAREEQLQEQWAQNKQQKRMTAQKYGF